MKNIIQNHRQDFSEIRRLCIICHGLDLTTSSLSSEESRLKISDASEVILQNLISGTLLQIAIALRINIYQNQIAGSNIKLTESAWFYYDDELISRPATLKQVCDKIIHADSVSKPILPEVIYTDKSKIAVQLKGIEYKNKAWTLNVVLELLAEDILELLDNVEDTTD